MVGQHLNDCEFAAFVSKYRVYFLGKRAHCRHASLPYFHREDLGQTDNLNFVRASVLTITHCLGLTQKEQRTSEAIKI